MMARMHQSQRNRLRSESRRDRLRSDFATAHFPPRPPRGRILNGTPHHLGKRLTVSCLD
jgi:hypothetical protein